MATILLSSFPVGGFPLWDAARHLAESKDDVRPVFPDLHREAFYQICAAISAGRLSVYVLNHELRYFTLDPAQFSDIDRLYAAGPACFRGVTFLTARGQATGGEPFVFWADLWSAFGTGGKDEGSPPKRQTRGRKPILDWEVVDNEVFRLMDYNGEFMLYDQWNCQAQLEKAIADFVSEKFGETPAESTIRERVSSALVKWRKAKSRAEN